MNSRALLTAILLSVLRLAAAEPCTPPQQVTEATPQQVSRFFASKHSRVVTFFGYSGAGYEDADAMLQQASALLDKYDSKRTIVNIGATAEGIGAVYELAKRKGFRTAGIVSTQAREQGVPLSPCVDFVFYVKDSSWGGYLPGTTSLSPTSTAMVATSNVLIAIGGGDVARDELLAAKRRGKRVTFIAADMNHQIARDKAASKGLPEPTDFRGSAHPALSPGS
jgi:hypothetical protein